MLSLWVRLNYRDIRAVHPKLRRGSRAGRLDLGVSAPSPRHQSAAQCQQRRRILGNDVEWSQRPHGRKIEAAKPCAPGFHARVDHLYIGQLADTRGALDEGRSARNALDQDELRTRQRDR
jgi:hypothetical protein